MYTWTKVHMDEYTLTKEHMDNYIQTKLHLAENRQREVSFPKWPPIIPVKRMKVEESPVEVEVFASCLLYTSDAADE